MDWRSALIEDGFAIFPNMVTADRIERARKAIDADLRVNFDPTRQEEYDNLSYCPDLRGTPVIRDLLEGTALSIILDEALGIGNLDWDGGQIAIRRAYNVDAPDPPTPHIDGFSSGKNGLHEGKVYSFTCLAGIFLTEVSQDFGGNFVVWPGSHRVYERYFSERGERAMHESMPEPELGAPRQLHAKAGDAILCHYQLGHAAAVNVSDVDRIAIFFRIALRDLDQHRWKRLTNVWDGWRLDPPRGC